MGSLPLTVCLYMTVFKNDIEQERDKNDEHYFYKNIKRTGRRS